MILGTRSRYAVMAMVDLANHSRAGKPVRLAEIAERQEIPLNYLEQIFAMLKQHELVQSVKGPGGGYRLAKTPNEMLISHIIVATNEDIKMTRCEGASHMGCMASKEQCVTHDLWEGLGEHIYHYLNAVSLEQVCNRKGKK